MRETKEKLPTWGEETLGQPPSPEYLNEVQSLLYEFSGKMLKQLFTEVLGPIIDFSAVLGDGEVKEGIDCYIQVGDFRFLSFESSSSSSNGVLSHADRHLKESLNRVKRIISTSKAESLSRSTKRVKK